MSENPMKQKNQRPTVPTGEVLYDGPTARVACMEVEDSPMCEVYLVLAEGEILRLMTDPDEAITWAAHYDGETMHPNVVKLREIEDRAAARVAFAS